MSQALPHILQDKIQLYNSTPIADIMREIYAIKSTLSIIEEIHKKRKKRYLNAFTDQYYYSLSGLLEDYFVAPRAPVIKLLNNNISKGIVNGGGNQYH